MHQIKIKNKVQCLQRIMNTMHDRELDARTNVLQASTELKKLNVFPYCKIFGNMITSDWYTEYEDAEYFWMQHVWFLIDIMLEDRRICRPRAPPIVNIFLAEITEPVESEMD